MTGWQMLLYKEMLRFWRVAGQTITGPILTAMLYLLVFGQALESHGKVYDSVSYLAFLVPGLAMMSLLQNAFANSSSSLIASKVMGNLVFLLLTPLSYWHWFVAYVGASVIRGLVVCFGVFLVAVFFTEFSFVAPLWIAVFALLGAALMGAHISEYCRGRKLRWDRMIASPAARSAETIEPFCVTCPPRRLRRAACSRWVAEWLARIASRRATSIASTTASPTFTPPALTVP